MFFQCNSSPRIVRGIESVKKLQSVFYPSKELQLTVVFTCRYTAAPKKTAQAFPILFRASSVSVLARLARLRQKIHGDLIIAIISKSYSIPTEKQAEIYFGHKFHSCGHSKRAILGVNWAEKKKKLREKKYNIHALE